MSGEADLHTAAELLARVDSMLATYKRRSSAFMVPGTFSLLRDLRAALAAATEPPKVDAHGFTDTEHDTLMVLIHRNPERVQGLLDLHLSFAAVERLRTAAVGIPDEPTNDAATVLRGLLDHAVQTWSPRGTGNAPLLAEWDDTDWADSGWTEAERVELRAAVDRVRDGAAGSFILAELDVPPGTAVRVDKDTT